MNKKGFTLIELLVVISIIGFLSSVVLVVISDTRERSVEKAIRIELEEFARLVEFSKQEIGSHLGVRSGWNSCDFSGNGLSTELSVQLMNSCNYLVDIGDKPFPDSQIHTGVLDTNSDDWSIIVGLPSGRFYCRGTNGFSEINRYAWVDVNPNTVGCWANP